QIASFGPERLILVDRDESGLYALHEDLRFRGFNNYLLVTTHIQQRKKMRMVFKEHRPHVVFHAAAFKHVPLMEDSPDEAVLNNVRGTQVVAQEAAAMGVERFVNISTDKAADPISVMGASKRIAEMVVRRVGQDFPATCFCSVRFGNVLGSKGSVIPIFERQIKEGGPVTVTHEDMTRYFMSIPEAVQLVLQAATLSRSGEADRGVFILEMGEPVKILDLAQKMISFLGNGQSADIGIEFVGLRPGERLHEVLVGRREHAIPTAHPLIKLICPGPAPDADSDEQDAVAATRTGLADLTADFDDKVARLIALAESHADRETMIEGLCALLRTYQASLLDEASSFPGSRSLACVS
ncbi:MAG: polysaccharide biosynthesis protein, partial [Thermoleophilia bacterium]|nr:polysaccharide biosynthesis protein [Thermoleophilia bacterium]